MLAGLLAAVVAVTSAASAHVIDKYGDNEGKSAADIFEGTYLDLMSPKNVILLIKNSAQTSYLTGDAVYKYGTNWNDRENCKVRVSVVYEAPGMPSLAGSIAVTGTEFVDQTLGNTIPYDVNGKPLSTDDGFNLDWKYVHIEMNTDPWAYSKGSTSLNTSQITTNARKTFLHEVGHALKLKHPNQNTLHADHYIGGLPYAIMNQGYVGSKSGAVAADITSHDRYCLIGKWGN